MCDDFKCSWNLEQVCMLFFRRFRSKWKKFEICFGSLLCVFLFRQLNLARCWLLSTIKTNWTNDKLNETTNFFLHSSILFYVSFLIWHLSSTTFVCVFVNWHIGSFKFHSFETYNDWHLNKMNEEFIQYFYDFQ